MLQPLPLARAYQTSPDTHAIPHRCSVAFHDASGTGLSNAFFTNSTESMAAPT